MNLQCSNYTRYNNYIYVEDTDTVSPNSNAHRRVVTASLDEFPSFCGGLILNNLWAGYSYSKKDIIESLS